MGDYRAVYLNRTGERVSITLKADDIQIAKRQLRRRGCKPIQIEPCDETPQQGKTSTRLFQARCLTIRGNERNVTIDSASADDARRQLRRSGLRVQDINLVTANNSRKTEIVFSTLLRVIAQSSNLFGRVSINLESYRRVVCSGI